MVMPRRRRNNKQKPLVTYAMDDIARQKPLPGNRAAIAEIKRMNKKVSPNRRRSSDRKETK